MALKARGLVSLILIKAKKTTFLQGNSRNNRDTIKSIDDKRYT